MGNINRTSVLSAVAALLALLTTVYPDVRVMWATDSSPWLAAPDVRNHPPNWPEQDLAGQNYAHPAETSKGNLDHDPSQTQSITIQLSPTFGRTRKALPAPTSGSITFRYNRDVNKATRPGDAIGRTGNAPDGRPHSSLVRSQQNRGR